MKNQLIMYFLSHLLSLLSPEMLKKLVDRILDFVEAHVLGSASNVDDRVVLPLLQMIRSTFDIPDYE